MQNVTAKVEGNKLILTVDLSQRQGPSSTGKTIIVATGSDKVPGHAGIRFGVNVFEKRS